jgi:hypothetical protein
MFKQKRIGKDPFGRPMDIFSLGVLCENGEITQIDYIPKVNKGERAWAKVDGKRYQLPGRVFNHFNDPVQFKVNLFLSESENELAEDTGIGDMESMANLSDA